MRILFDATRPVKTNTRRRFALGLLPVEKPAAKPANRAPFTAADLAWAAANLNANATDYTVAGQSDTAAALEDRAAQARWDDQFNADTAAVRRGTPVRLDADEEALRYGLRTAETLAAHAAEWARYQSRKADLARRLA